MTKPKKFKIRKNYSIDSEVCDKWESLMSSQEKGFSETIEEYMREDINTFENPESITNKPTKIEPDTKTLEEEFNQFIKDRVTPIFDKPTEMSAVDERQLRALVNRLDIEKHKIEMGLKLSGSLILSEIPKHNRLEQDRQRQLEAAKQYREKRERFDLMQELPGAHLLQEEAGDNNKSNDIDEAQLLSQEIIEQARQRKIQSLKVEVERKQRGDWSDDYQITKEEFKIPKREDRIRNKGHKGDLLGTKGWSYDPDEKEYHYKGEDNEDEEEV